MIDYGDLQVLPTNEAIRKRPGMYVGDIKDPKALTGLIIEAMCVSRAFACDGKVSKINIVLSDNDEVCVYDDGPGFPVGLLKDGRSALEHILGELAACKKMKTGDTHHFCTYGIVTNVALCEYFEAHNTIGGNYYTLKYKQGKLVQPLKYEGEKPQNGLWFEFKFDPEIFGDLKIDRQALKTEIDKIQAETKAKINLVW